LVLALLLIIAASCGDMQEKIDWNTDNVPQKLIVEGEISNDLKFHELSLKKSADYFVNKELETISGATVTVKGNGEEIDYNEDPARKGVYVSEKMFQGKRGEEYALTISLTEEVDGEREFSASTKVIEGMPITGMEAQLFKNPLADLEGDEDEDADTLILAIKLIGQEPAHIENFYKMKVYRNGQALNDTASLYTVFSDFEYDINGDSYISFSYEDDFKEGDEFTVALYSITEHYFWFLQGISKITEEGDPLGFGGAPANAVGNVNKGKALGYFYGAEISRFTTKITLGEDIY